MTTKRLNAVAATVEKKPRRKLDYYGAKAVRNDDIIVGAFDSETDGLGGKLLSLQWGIFGEITYDDSPDKISNFFNAILQYPKPVIWYAHFAQYDWRYLMDEIAERGYDAEICMRNDNDIYEIRIKTKKGKVIMRDSYALWNSKLEKLAQSFCPEIPKLEIDFDKVRFDPSNPEHVKYAKRDVQILLVGLPRLIVMLSKHFGVTPNGTFASTALKGWQKTLPADKYYSASKFDAKELFVRQAYYGGLVFLTDTNEKRDCTTYDINSSYPASMMEFGVPYGRSIETTDYHDARMGIYQCRVRAPEGMRIPILPARDQKGAMRWYAGEFETVCTNRELIFAAQHGYEILDIISGLVFEETVFPFTDFINLCRQIRQEFAVGPGIPLTAEEILAKFMQNSLYGKFGSRRERRRIFSAACASLADIMGSEPYDAEGKWYVRKEIDEDMRTIPHWATFITAHSRLRLLQAAYTVGPENVLYGDTDSMTIISGTEAGLNVGNEYGQWKKEKEWEVFRAIAPKVYTGRLKDGKWVGAAKGLPRKNLTDSHWQELLEDGKTSAQAMSLPSLRVSLKKGVTPAEILLRKSSTLENSSNFLLLPNGGVQLKMYA